MTPPCSPCPCGRTDARGRPLSLQACCGPWLDGAAAPDAHALMRSRYTAHALGRRDHLQATWHPDTLPTDLSLDADTQWLGLQVRSHRETGPDAAEVHFVARWRGRGEGGGRAQRLEERSRFLRVQGRWLYLDALGGEPPATPKRSS